MKPLGCIFLLQFVLACCFTGWAQQTQNGTNAQSGTASQGGAKAQSSPAAQSGSAQSAKERRDGQHDFDFEIGRWRTRLKRLARPLSGSSTWVEYSGTSVVTKVWEGRANLVELEVDGPSGHIEGLSLRLYNPGARQWSLNFSNSRQGTLTTPTIGEFKDGRGEFYGQDTLGDGRVILVRFVITCDSVDRCHFEQAFSDDGGKNWEANWIADDTRISE
jgi:hypothetical protein